MVIAILKESDMKLPDELLEAIIGKVGVCKLLFSPIDFLSRLIINGSHSSDFFAQTFADADADQDGKICKTEWKDFVVRNPGLLRNMTLPYLKYATSLL